jgi:outer membrane receptor protein involved in Fe transport
VFTPTSGVSPLVTIHRSGFYRAAYAQDSWTVSKRFAFNYGLRADWYKQSESLQQNTVDCIYLSPRLNFQYDVDKLSTLRWSYNRLFNTPPIAQGAAIGSPIVPEVLDQYDISLEHELAPRQKAKLAYYVKQMRHQVDTGLLVPGSEIGLYSAVNFQIGAVHGIEFAYDLEPKKDPKTKKPYGWDAFLNYSYSIAAPNGTDNTGAPAPNFNDHDQRNTVGLGGSYTWKSGYNVGITENYGSGLASSPIPPSTIRVQRATTNLQFTTGPGVFKGRGGLGLEIDNVFDDRSVINFDSGFSGTRFDIGRRVMFSVFGSF